MSTISLNSWSKYAPCPRHSVASYLLTHRIEIRCYQIVGACLPDRQAYDSVKFEKAGTELIICLPKLNL